MWQAIQYVGSGLALVAFLAAGAAWVLKAQIEQRQRLIARAPEAERAALIADALEVFKVDTGHLTKEQKYGIVTAQIRQRATRFLIVAIVTVTLSVIFALLAAFAIYRAGSGSSPAPAEPGFDVSLEGARFFPLGDQVVMELNLKFFSTDQDINVYSTIFTGVVVAYDQAAVASTGSARARSCREVAGCLQSHVFSEFVSAPTVVRGSTRAAIHTVDFTIPKTVRAVAVEAQFYQREATSGQTCVFDTSRPAPPDSVPFLKRIDKHGRTRGFDCVGARFRQIIPVPAAPDPTGTGAATR